VNPAEAVSAQLASMLASCSVRRLWAEQDEGPYHRDAQPVRCDVVEDCDGVPLQLGIRLADPEGARPDRAVVEIWQCDALGGYSGFPPAAVRDCGVTDRQGLIRALRAELPGPVHELQKAHIAPVDLRQAAIGPGMAVFSRFARVIEPDGSTMRVRTALGLINQVLDQVLDEQEQDFDAETRWAIHWFAQFYEGRGSLRRREDAKPHCPVPPVLRRAAGVAARRGPGTGRRRGCGRVADVSGVMEPMGGAADGGVRVAPVSTAGVVELGADGGGALRACASCSARRRTADSSRRTANTWPPLPTTSSR
jgi:hypothetical protein